MSEKRVSERLWQYAYQLDDEVSSLKAESDALFEKHKLAEARRLPCTHPDSVEVEYWETMKKLNLNKEECDALLKGIEMFVSGGEVPERFQHLFPKPTEAEQLLSKRRRAIEAERARLSAPLDKDELFFATIFEPDVAEQEKQACVVHRPIFMVDGVSIPQARRVRSNSGSFATKSGGRVRKV